MSKPPVVIVAGGENSRFFPLNTLTHKSGLSLLGKPLIIRSLENLQRHGFTKAYLVVSPKDYAGRGLSSVLHEYKLSIDVTLVPQMEPKGMGEALLLVADQLTDRFAVSLPYHEHAGDVLDRMLNHDEETVVASLPTTEPWNCGILEIQDNKAISLVEKPKPGEEPSNQRIVGIYLLNKTYLDFLKNVQTEHYSFEKALNGLMKVESVGVIELSEQLPSLKFPWHLFEFQAQLFAELTSHRDSSATIADTAIIDETAGPVYIGAGATIGQFAKISGPAYIGEHALVGDYSMVRSSSLEKHVVVGANTEVVRSIIMEGSTVHFGYVADSIIGHRVKIGAGLIVGNKRLDRDEIKVKVKDLKIGSGRNNLGVIIGDEANLGIRVATMPGVSIGSRAVVFPGSIVYHNVDHDAVHKTNS